MGNDLTLPLSVQRHICMQLMCGNDVEIRLQNGEYKVISLRKKVESFPCSNTSQAAAKSGIKRYK